MKEIEMPDRAAHRKTKLCTERFVELRLQSRERAFHRIDAGWFPARPDFGREKKSATGRIRRSEFVAQAKRTR